MTFKKYEYNNKPKEFAYSYTRLKNYETCPYKYNEVDVLKHYKDGGEALDEGIRFHDAMKSRVGSGKELPAEFSYMERWAVHLTRQIHPYQIIQVEKELAATRNLKPAGWFDSNVHVRAKIDYLILIPTENNKFKCKTIDYKTGKPDKNGKDDTQLMLNAALIFINYPDVDNIWSEFLFAKYNDVKHFKYSRQNIRPLWNELQLRVTALEQATKDNNFPPRKNGLCLRHCPVTECEFNGANQGEDDE